MPILCPGFIVGWDDPVFKPRFVDTPQQAREAFPEVFDGQISLQEMVKAVEMVNSEGNYNEFVFRPAWPWEA
jgi:hypothetical protein